MKSFREMRGNGELKRADAEKMKIEDLHFEPGFNLQGRNDEQDEDDEALFQYIMDGGRLPQVEVRPREEGGAWVVDGHRRVTQLRRADSAGAPLRDPKDGELWVPVVQFVGNDVDRTVRLLTSNANKKATPLQVAEVYARLERFNMTPDQIAKKFTKTRQHVDQMLILAHANSDVHQMVKDGTVSATVAVDQVRKHGELAGAFIKAANDKTGGKVTARSVKPWTPPTKIVAPVLERVGEFLSCFTTADRVLLEQDKPVEVSAAVLRSLFEAFGTIDEARQAAEQKSRNKAAKAAQGELE